jgi:tetratricopeptide (TPR) repeat protein
MLVDERLAGKKGKCKACQQPITVPALPASNSSAEPTAPAEQRAAAPADVEAEAAALFADEPKTEEQPAEVKTIDFNCPFCDEPIKLSADLAGKRAPCPECKHIIKVPELVKKDPKDWRKVEAHGPSGARLPDQPAPEGAWGSTTIRGVGTQSLVEAGVIPKVERPRTLWQKIRWPVLGVNVSLVLILGGWIISSWWARRAVEREVQAALAFADSPEADPATKAALALAAGEYFLRSSTAHPDPRTGAAMPPAKAANNQFGTALTTLRSAPQGEERDALLTDLALAEVEMGGDKPDTDQELRLPWDKTQQLMLATLREIHDAQARLFAFRAVAQRLREHGQAARVLPLANQLFAAADADKAAALSVVGLDFLKADDRSSADRAAEAALQLYRKDANAKDAKVLPLRAEVVALALLMEKKDLPAAADDNDEDKTNEQIGRAEALARQGKWEEARKEANKAEDMIVRFRARLAIAAAAVDAKPPESKDIESALKMTEEIAGKKAATSWSMLHLVQLALQAGLPEEHVRAVADKIRNRALRGRAQLAIFRSQLDKANQVVEDAAADNIDAKSLARSLAAQALARHNVRVNASYAGVVQTWPQPLRSFGALGVALGLQDRGK